MSEENKDNFNTPQEKIPEDSITTESTQLLNNEDSSRNSNITSKITFSDEENKKFHREHLTPRQAIFVIEYLKDLNATQAAIRSGYSEHTAQEIGSENLSKPIISKEIDNQLKARAVRNLITADKVLRDLNEIATVDIAEAFNENGSLKSIHDIPLAVRKTIAGIEVDEIWEYEGEGKERRKVQCGETKKIKFWDKNKAIENLCRHLKLLTDKLDVGGHDGGALLPPTIIFEASKNG